MVWNAANSDGSDIFLYEAESDTSSLLLSEDFAPDIDDSQWHSFGRDEVNRNFDGDGESLFFTGGESNDDSRHLVTVGLNVAEGGNTSFDLIFGDGANAGEEVALEFSINNGMSWQDIAIYSPQELTGWAGIQEVIPSAAQTESTQFRCSSSFYSYGGSKLSTGN